MRENKSGEKYEEVRKKISKNMLIDVFEAAAVVVVVVIVSKPSQKVHL